MKKLVFSAFSVVAFSGTLMANTSNVEPEANDTLYTISCTDVYHNTYIEFVDAGLPYDAPSEAWGAYKECMGH